jgi:hypothetical protein
MSKLLIIVNLYRPAAARDINHRIQLSGKVFQKRRSSGRKSALIYKTRLKAASIVAEGNALEENSQFSSPCKGIPLKLKCENRPGHHPDD